MKKSLSRLDLNLLVTLQLLLQELSVTRTAKKLNVTPSSVSKSLNKLRDWFHDPLFVKTPNGLKPTPLAQSMAQDLSDWLHIGSQLVDRRCEEVSKGVKFHLCIESPLLLIHLNALSSCIRSSYPDATIKTSNWDYDSLDAIISGDADIGFTGRESHPRSRESLSLLPYFIYHEVIFADLPVVYMRDDHPALNEPWTLDTFLQYAHINIVWEKSETWALDDVLSELGRQRKVALTLSSFEQSLYMASQPGHEMFTTAPAYCQQYARTLHPNLVCKPIPVSPEMQEKLTIPFTLIWHKRNAHNPRIKWLKETIKSLYNQSKI
ncbi:HTH-type transcriptional regulator YidZ [Enterovibrio coralii]|uniref:Transcriptional regulator n=1 Tax=Enterovibrio coralii TaxID=294935 RepID=A0A135I7Y4_9GAMM|nr:HTH-type transcriptional regulator YidZ [Enterovibrio coralii]KXF81561.1 transcriptional regulator [Enterovibrio coralii]